MTEANNGGSFSGQDKEKNNIRGQGLQGQAGGMKAGQQNQASGKKNLGAGSQVNQSGSSVSNGDSVSE